MEADGKTIAINSKETIQALDSVKELYETMIPFVVLTWIGLIIVWPTKKFFDRVGERLTEMETQQ